MSHTLPSGFRALTIAAVASVLLAGTVVVTSPPSASATTVTQTFDYSTAVQTFTVPTGVTSLAIAMRGATGGIGGTDSWRGPPIAGGYRGYVTGTVAVTPGETIRIGVGKAGDNGSKRNGTTNTVAAVGGTNPIGGFAGGPGGIAGHDGASGNGGGGGAATVVTTGSTTVVAAGAGGGGGSGAPAGTGGRPGEASFRAQPEPVSTTGRVGLDTDSVCAPASYCDGGASGGGGGGSIGGDHGTVEYGSGSANEYFGYGGFPGSNDVAAMSTSSAAFEYYPTNGVNGSVTISYNEDEPDAPSAVAGTANDEMVDLTWLAPLGAGGSSISDYTVQFSIASATPVWKTFAGAVSSATSTTVTGLVNGTAYQFRVSATNTFGNGDYSSSSESVTPSTVPGVATLTSVTPAAGSAEVEFTAASSEAPLIRYDYRLGDGDWIATGTSSPFTIGGLSDGATYSVTLRAVNAIGIGPTSNSRSVTPAAIPGAPTITSVTPAVGSASIAFTSGSTGGRDITDYEYQLDGGTWGSLGAVTGPFTITGLDNGTSYALKLRSVAGAIDGTESASSTFTTPAAPGSPTVTTVTTGDTSISLSYKAGTTGGLDITGYEYRLTSSGAWVTGSTTTSPMIITGLTNGATYQVSLRALNAVGNGTASSAVSATPATVPGAPALVGDTTSGSDQELSAEFTAPVDNGGSAIIAYEYSTDSGATWRQRATGTTASPLVISTLSSDGTTRLSNGTTYLVEVRAVNAVGPGIDSGIAKGIPRTSPDAPGIINVTSLPAALRVELRPVSNGGSPLTAYQYRLNAGNWVDTGTLGSEFVIDGLANGGTYAVQLRALNAVGTSAASGSSNGIPASVPGRATIGSVTPGDGSLKVTVSLGTTGGSAVTDWQFTTDGGTTWASASDADSPVTIAALSTDGATVLTNGVSYPIALRAINAVGIGAASATLIVAPVASPAAPTVTLTPRNGAVLVDYVQGNNGGGSIVEVQYSLDSGAWIDAGSLGGSFVVGSLANGTSYRLQVRAVNSTGAGTASALAAVIPHTVPDAVTSVIASPDGGKVIVGWKTPAFNGGSAITGYLATAWSAASGGAVVQSCSTTDLQCEITSLTNGTLYYVSVVAQNLAGDSNVSSPRVAVKPLAKPSAPTITSISAANTFVRVNFTTGAPGSSAITSYQYSLNSGFWVSVPTTSSPITISGLTNGTSYAVVLRAVNASGAGASSNTVSATPYSLPDIPDSRTFDAVVGSGSVALSWDAPNANGSPITKYNVTLWSASQEGGQVKTCDSGTTRSCTLAGLTNGTTYWATVEATNIVGTTARSSRLAFTPGVPSAVTSLAATPGNGTVDLSWTAGSTGGSAITDYTIWFATPGSTTYTQFVEGVSTATSKTITGLTNGTEYRFIVYAVNGFGTGSPSAAVASTPLALGVAPTLGAAVATNDGYTASIDNYDAGTNYTVSVDNGAATISAGTITVTGLAGSASAIITLVAERSGYTTTTATTTASALGVGADLTLSSTVQTLDGYTFTLTNFDDDFSWGATSTTGVVSFDNGVVSVTGLAAGQSSTVTIVATQVGERKVEVDVVGAAVVSGTAIALTGATSVSGGFTAKISNYDSNARYTATVSAGQVRFSGSTFVVSKLDAGVTATVTITATKSGFATVSARVTGVALVAPVSPVAVPPTDAASGASIEADAARPSADLFTNVTNVGSPKNRATPPKTPGLDPGIGQVLNGEKSLAATLTSSPSGRTLTSGPLSMTVSSDGDQPTMEYLEVEVNTSLRVSIAGFLASTEVGVWVFSTPVQVANANVRSDESAQVSFLLPSSIMPGNHTLVATGTSASGDEVTLKIGFVVTESVPAADGDEVAQPTAASSESFSWSWGWLVALGSLAVLAALLFVVFRRRGRADVDATNRGAN